MTVGGVGIDSGAVTAAERESRIGEGHDRKISRDQEGEVEKADYEDEGEDGDEEEEKEGEEEESGDKDGEEDGDEDGGEEEAEDDEDEEEDDDDDEYDERVSSSEQDEDEDAWEDVAYQSLARNLGRRRRRYLLSRSSQVLRDNLQKLGGMI